ERHGGPRLELKCRWNGEELLVADIPLGHADAEPRIEPQRERAYDQTRVESQHRGGNEWIGDARQFHARGERSLEPTARHDRNQPFESDVVVELRAAIR